MSELPIRAIATFAAVADTLLPGIDIGATIRFSKLMALLPGDDARRDLQRLLSLLGSAAGGAILYGHPRPFTTLTPEQRVKALRRMAGSRSAQVRRGFTALKSLTGYLMATPPHRVTSWPVWRAMGYPGPNGSPPARSKPLHPMAITSDTELTTDAVVVGSGAGGGTVAAVLATAGLGVVVVEKGGYHNEADFTHLEADAYQTMYLDGGFGSTADGTITILAGSTLGGGTVVNYTTSFPTPESIREEWDREAGFTEVFTGPAFETSAQAVQQRLGVNLDHNQPSRRDRRMEKGLSNLGWHVDAMPRNVVGCREEECGYCGMGCRIGAKQSSLNTWLEDAAAAGARIVVDAEVGRVLLENGQARGVEATVGSHRLVVRARVVILAAGALNTPPILLRSGIRLPALGRYLRLHPVTGVWGRFDEPVEPWTGIIQARYSDEFADLDGEGYGFRLETAAIHPLMPAMFMGWENGTRFRDDLLALAKWSPIGILLRDRDAGRVSLGREGRPVWHYRLSHRDLSHIRQGVRRASEVLAEAGALEVVASTTLAVRWNPRRDSLEDYLRAVDRFGYGPHQTSYLTFHQMGSARMGTDPRKSVAGADNSVHGVDGLYVMDGSCFPTASGVNPMISIATIAHRGASMLAAELG